MRNNSDGRFEDEVGDCGPGGPDRNYSDMETVRKDQVVAASSLPPWEANQPAGRSALTPSDWMEHI